MITEDHVSFETAKLLKEKGFNEPCIWLYSKKGEKHYASYYHSPWPNNDLAADEWACCTQAMAMKWLREVHSYYIEIRYSFVGEDECGYVFKIRKIGEDDIGIWSLNDELYDSYEDACEAACIYALKNLI